MYIPELDALIFLATEFLEEGVDQPNLEAGINELHEAAGTAYTPSQKPRRSKVPERLSRRGCIDLLEKLGVPLQDDILPIVWEALGGGETVAVLTVGLLLALVCQAEFDAKAAFIFWLLDKDGDHKLTKGDVIGAIGPLMHTAQAGIVFMGSTEAGPKNAASLWEDFRDSMRDLATDQVAAAIASGAFDEVDATRVGTIQEAQFRVMIECVATDVASMMVNVTEMQGEVERVSGSRLDSSNSPATGVKNALHKLVTKYAGGEVAERLLGAPAKQRRKSGMSGRPPRGGSGTSPQQASRFSPLRSRAGSQKAPDKASASSSRQNSGQLQTPGPGVSLQHPRQVDSVLGSQNLQPRQQSLSGLSSQSSQPGATSLLTPQTSQPQWQSNLVYSPHSSMTQQQSKAAFLPDSTGALLTGSVSAQQPTLQGVRLTSTPKFPTGSNAGSESLPGEHAEGSSQQPWLSSQGPSPIQVSSQPRLQVQLPLGAQASGSGDMQVLSQGASAQPYSSMQQALASDTHPEQQTPTPMASGQGFQPQGSSNQRLGQQTSTASVQAEASTSTPQSRLKSPGQQPRTFSGMQRQGWFQDDDSQDPNLHNPRDPDFERRNSGALASPSTPSSPGPFDLARISGQVNAELQAQEERRDRLRQERMQRADRAAAAASAAVKADFKAKEDAENASKIDPKHALITLVAGLTVRYYLMDIIKVMVLLAILLGDASFVTALYTRRHLSLELSLGIVFFTNIVLSLAALTYIVSGINTDIFTWAKDYLAALKDDDSAVNTKKDNTLSKLAAMEGAVPKQLQPAFKKVMQKLQQAGKKTKGEDKDDDDNSTADSLERSQSQYGNYDDDDTASQGQASTPRGHTGGSSRNRVQFARRSTRGVGAPRRGVPASKGKDKQDPQDYMGKAKQLWNYVGKFTGLETMGGGEQGGQEALTPPSGHSRSFGRQWTNSSTRSFKPSLARSRLGRGSTPPGVADDYKTAALLTRAEEGDSTALHPQRTHSHARPIMRDAGSKSWAPRDRPGDARQAGVADSDYEDLV